MMTAQAPATLATFDELFGDLLPEPDSQDGWSDGSDWGAVMSPQLQVPSPNAALTPPSPSTQQGKLPTPLRCLDATHPTACAHCIPPPHDDSFELIGDYGKRNGEKKIRSLLARAPEWVNSASREQTAASLAVGSRLREALEHRKSVLLRKNDLFALCRLWRYKSNLWQSRKDRPARAIRGAGAVVLAAAPVPAPQGAPSPLLPAGLSTFPLGAPDSIAAVSREHLALVGTSLTEVRRLTAASVAAFSEPCPSAQCANMQLLPASSLDLITRFMGASDPKLSYAISALSDLSSKLAVAHMNMETRLLQLTPAERKSPAWQVLGAREAPWEVYLRDIATLAAFAVSNCEHTTLEASARAVGFTPPEVALLHRDSVVASALIPCASDDAVFRGGSFVQQLSVVLASILTTAKMFPYETYLEITSLLLSKSSAHAAACMHALCTRRDTVRNTMSELRARHGGGAPMLPSTTERLQIECL